jgi:hypothetical protein
MKAIPCLLLCSLAATASAAPEIDVTNLLERARAVPGEFSAQALTRLASLETLPRARRVQLLEEAFERAAGAAEPYKRRALALAGATLGPWKNRVYAQNLDALTLRSRVVEAMLPLDAAKARQLLLSIPPVTLPPIKCSAFLSYDVEEYYTALLGVAKQDSDGAALIAQAAAALASSAQVGPMAQVIARSGLDDQGYQKALAAFTASLEKLTSDDRSFCGAGNPGREIVTLVAGAKSHKLPTEALLTAYRGYLVRQYSGPRCADVDRIGTARAFGVAAAAQAVNADPRLYFNSELREDPVPEIKESEIQPASAEGQAEDITTCASEACKAIDDKYGNLILTPDKKPYQAVARATPTWQSRAAGFLNTLVEWKRDEKTGLLDYYREKASRSSDLFSLVSEGSTRQAVAGAIFKLAASSPEVRGLDRAEWFLPVNALLARISGSASELEAGAQSGDAVIPLFCDLERVAPRAPGDAIPLL